MRARARIDVMLKPGIADPQGQTIERSLPSLGWQNVSGVRMGKHLELEVDGPSMDAIRTQLDEMCRKLLANPVIERYEFDLEPV